MIEFSPGDKMKTVDVNIIDDGIFQTQEYYLIQLFNSDGDLLSESRIMIIDNDIDMTTPTGMQ